VVLVNRCQLVDQVYSALTPNARRNIAQLVESMSGGMIWSSRTFADQGGVLTDERQLSRYCRNVIGLPFLFGVRLLHQQRTGTSAISADLHEDCLMAGEMVQLANITRDIEADLRRGIAYHPALAQDLGRAGQEAGQEERIRRVREELLVRALAMAPAYQRMMEALPFRRVSLSRASGVLMLQFTDRYYRSCARNVGRRPWPGPRSRLALIANTAYHVFARRGSARTVRRIAERFVRFALETRP
jgi:phytoene/squalene synthetase